MSKVSLKDSGRASKMIPCRLHLTLNLGRWRPVTWEELANHHWERNWQWSSAALVRGDLDNPRHASDIKKLPLCRKSWGPQLGPVVHVLAFLSFLFVFHRAHEPPKTLGTSTHTRRMGLLDQRRGARTNIMHTTQSHIRLEEVFGTHLSHPLWLHAPALLVRFPIQIHTCRKAGCG